MVRKLFGSQTCLDAMVCEPLGSRTSQIRGHGIVLNSKGSRTWLNTMICEPFGSLTSQIRCHWIVLNSRDSQTWLDAMVREPVGSRTFQIRGHRIFLNSRVPKLGSAQWYANHLVPGLCRSEVTGSFLMHGVPGTRASSCTCTWSPSPSCPGPLASSWTCRPAPWYFHGPHTSRPPSCRQCQVPPRLVDDNGSLPQRGDITNSGSSSNELLTSVIFLLPCC